MATVHKRAGSGGYPGERRRRWPRTVLLLALLTGGALLVWFWQSLTARALLDASYGARVACSCRYFGGRDFAGCEREIAEETSFVFVSADDETKSVSASVPLLSSQRATYREGAGCMLEKWED
ncbi:MAG TPA: hypothetical protein VJM34_16295 [Novosphingobium sp.]|nr:hypothetical protein [Novosphingobium sp.]